MTADLLIAHTTETVRHPWPENTFIQGGAHGLVLSKSGHYATAFVEVVPTGLDTFIRGEGATIQEAEDAAWAKYQSYLACPRHEFEARQYTNGAGICRHCKMFASDVFTAEQLGLHCQACGIPTNYSSAGGNWYCETHAPNRMERRAMNLAAGIEPGPLEALLDEMIGLNEE